MTDDFENTENDSEDSLELKPVKSPLKGILRIGSTIIIGGTVMVIVAPLMLTQRTAGVTRSARLKYERQKADAEAIILEQTNQDIQTVTNEETTD